MTFEPSLREKGYWLLLGRAPKNRHRKEPYIYLYNPIGAIHYKAFDLDTPPHEAGEVIPCSTRIPRNQTKHHLINLPLQLKSLKTGFRS